MSQTVAELEWVGLVKSFLAKPAGTASAEEGRAWQEFYREYTGIVRARIGRNHHGWIDSNDDFFQLVWIILMHRMRTSYLELRPVAHSTDGLPQSFAMSFAGTPTSMRGTGRNR